MKRKGLLILVIVFLSGTLFLFAGNSKTVKNEDVFNCILKDTNGKVVEYGLTTNFYSKEDGNKVCKEILKKLKVSQDHYRNTIKNGKIYCIEFKDNNLEGYVQSTKYDNYNVVTINVKEKNKINELNRLEEQFTEIINNKDIKFFKYVKAQIDGEDLQKTNKKIIALLKNARGENIETIKLDKGYSTTAYTKKYNPINVNGKPIDFNYALCRYHSGNYIIMGTPEILISY
ncbi:YwmB family TATA-box binding protein [Clostridium lundense]|uniref:YwmB family TATA-box binding protein n=1 Tax=Clostridium lundense TaxID=319475 RepID=UPI0004865003|nr:YwmB family TATA-box binding protein [Clostridium lundense]